MKYQMSLTIQAEVVFSQLAQVVGGGLSQQKMSPQNRGF